LARFCLFFAETPHLLAQASKGPVPLSKVEGLEVDETVQTVMRRDDVPAISLAIVRHGQIAYLKAYGDAELPTELGHAERTPTSRTASISTRFAIGSVSKEFTAAAILMLADRGKLSLDDTVSKYLPALTEARQVTIRELLNHTSGYRDYFLQEYIPARMQRPTSVDTILRTWAERPRDFPPGEQWQYSGTNYVIAGRIVEEVTGEPYEKFLADNVLLPMGITDETYADHPKQSERNAVGYYRFALGPPRPAPLTGRNWLFAMADLEMIAKDVALWDISVINQSLLSAASYRAMSSDIKATNGRSTGYGLGFFVTDVAGVDGTQYLMLHHPGEISGFRSGNFVLPDLKAAVVILTNAEYSDATS
jgi:D-alanyl-D-alanine carboxypeptidase